MSNPMCDVPFCEQGTRPGAPPDGAACGAQPCAACRDTVRGHLLRLPGLYEESAAALVRGRRPPAARAGGRRGRRPHGGIGLDDRVVSVRADVLGVLASWSALVAEERARSVPGDGGVPLLAAFLDEHLDWLLGHPAGADFAREVADLDAVLRAALEPRPAGHWDVGPCGAPGCGRPVRATLRGDHRSEVRCDGGHVWQARQWLLLGPAARTGASGASGASGEEER